MSTVRLQLFIARFAVVLASTSFFGACAEKDLISPSAAHATLRVQPMIGAQQQTTTAVDIYVGYARLSGELVQLLKHRASITGSTQTISIDVDLRSCLDDESRAPPPGVCTLRVDVVLRDANDVALDSVTTQSVAATPGAEITAPSVDLTAGVEISSSYCTGPQGAIFVAFQDGTGPWQRAPLVNGVATFRIRSGRGGITSVTPIATGGFSITTYYSTVSELPSLAVLGCLAPTGTAVVTTPFAGITALDATTVSIGTAFQAALPGVSSVQVQGVPTGLQDMLAVRHSFNPATSIFVPTSVVLRRGINITGADTLPVVDFAAGAAPVASPVTMIGAGTDPPFLRTTLYTSRIRTGVSMAALSGSPNTWFGLPPAIRQPADIHLVTGQTSSADQLSTRIAARAVAAPTAVTLTLGPPMATPTASLAATQPYVRIRLSYVAQPEYSDVIGLNAFQSGPQGFRQFFVQTSKGYAATAGGSTTIELPDLSNVAGWDPAWAPRAGSAISWNLSAIRITTGALYRSYADGDGYIGATRSGTITP